MSTCMRTMLSGLATLALSPLFEQSTYQPPNLKTELFSGTYRGFERNRFAITGRILAGVKRWHLKAGPNGTYPTQNSSAFTFGQSIRDSKITLAMPLSVGVVYKFGNR